MKLQELGAQRQTEQAALVLEKQAGRRVDFSALGPRRAQGMLAQVTRLLREHRNSPEFHHSETDPAYLQLLMLEKGLKSRVDEVAMGSSSAIKIDMKNPEVVRLQQKLAKGEKPSPGKEQDLANQLAAQTATQESRKKPASMVKEQTELQQAQVVLAAQDMIDRLQGMLEDISEMQFKDLPALADSIKNDMGVDQATQYQGQASAALTQLLQAVQAGKTELEAAQGVLTGQEMQVPGQDQGMPAAGQELDLDLDLDQLPAEDEPEPEGAEAELGRERR